MTVREAQTNGSAPQSEKSDSPPEDTGETVPECDRTESVAGQESQLKRPTRRLQLSLSMRSLAIAVVIAVLMSTVGMLSWKYLSAQHKLEALDRQSVSTAHAEQAALDYAVNAAVIDSADLNAWKGKLVAGTSPELNVKLTEAAKAMEQILVPLQWNSTATPLAAKVRSEAGGVYVVDSFVSVLTKTLQAPEPLQSTATYSITIDSNKNWQISDVGGIGNVVGPK